MQLAWTDPPAPAHLPRIGWDTCPALQAPHALLALKVSMNAKQKVRVKVKWLEEVSHLTKSSLVGHVKRPRPKLPNIS